MFPYPNQFLPSKKTRDFGLADAVIPMSNARLEAVAAGPTIGPDTLVLLSALNPDTVVSAPTGTPVIGTDTVFGITATYSNNTSILSGLVGVVKIIPGMSFRVLSDTALTNQAGVNAVIGNRYFLTTTTDADGFPHQVLAVSGGNQATSMIRVVDGDFSTNVLEVQIVA